jgi:hypothetical protein
VRRLYARRHTIGWAKRSLIPLGIHNSRLWKSGCKYEVKESVIYRIDRRWNFKSTPGVGWCTVSAEGCPWRVKVARKAGRRAMTIEEGRWRATAPHRAHTV